MIAAILAADEYNGIAKNGYMPWKSKEDFKHFKKTTVGGGKNIVVMGRNTAESLPTFPLPDRVNFIITSNPKNVNEVSNWNQVIELSEMCEDLFIIGGESVYRQAFELGIPEIIYISRIYRDYDCDQFVDMSLIKKKYHQAEQIAHEDFILEVWIKK